MGKSYRRNYDDDYEDNYSKRGDKKKTRNYENALRQKDVQKLMKYDDDDYEERS